MVYIKEVNGLCYDFLSITIYTHIKFIFKTSIIIKISIFKILFDNTNILQQLNSDIYRQCAVIFV